MMQRMNKEELKAIVAKMDDDDTVIVYLGEAKKRSKLIKALLAGEVDEVEMECTYTAAVQTCTGYARRKYGKGFRKTHGIKFLYTASQNGIVTVRLRPKN